MVSARSLGARSRAEREQGEAIVIIKLLKSIKKSSRGRIPFLSSNVTNPNPRPLPVNLSGTWQDTNGQRKAQGKGGSTKIQTMKPCGRKGDAK